MFKQFTAATFVFTLTVPLTAFAQETMDADGDGLVTAEEFAVVYPDAASGTFEQIDLNGDGALGEEEIAAAREVGVLPDGS